MTVEYGFVEARIRCSKYLPYTYAHVASLIPVERPGLGTMAVDRHMRVSYDPAVFKQWCIDESTATILHEDFHILLGHHQRAKEYLGPNPTQEEAQRWNTACDMAVNVILRDGGVPMGNLENWVFPEKFNYPKNLSAEEYWERLTKDAEKDQPPPPEDSDDQDDQEDDQDDGSDGQDGEDDQQDDQPQEGGGDSGDQDGDPQDGDDGSDAPGDSEADGNGGSTIPGTGADSSGSCSDGIDKPWEGPVDSDTPTMDEFDQKMLQADAAQKMEQYAKNQGTLPGSLAQWADGILRPKKNPWQRLRAAVRCAAVTVRGLGDYTFQRPPRRQAGGFLRLPASIQPVPRVAVIVDTSGSMSGKELAKGLGVVKQGLQSLPPEQIVVISGDTCAMTTQKVFRAQDVTLAGGGGTDMGAIVQEAADARPAPDAIIVVTDGWTPWPRKKVRPKCLVALTESSQKAGVPDWMTTICLDD
jgi:predicted metal-dependent peptidase